MKHAPRDPNFAHRVRASFMQQSAMTTLGASLGTVDPGEVVLELPFRADLTQQHGFLHAGIVTSVLDSACGYAALSLMEPGAAVLTVEFKVNLLAPAKGLRFCAIGRVVRAGRTLTVVSGEFHAVDPAAGPTMPDALGPTIAMMTGTMMAVRDRPELVD